MANTIITKNSSTASSVPTAGDLVQGELAVNVTDKRLFTENASGTVVELGTNPSTIDINAGTIDGTTIGGTTPAAGSFTTGQFGTSLNVDGTATMDGLTVDGNASFKGTIVSIESANPLLTLKETDTTDLNTNFRSGGGALFIRTSDDTGNIYTSRIKVNHATGDISFYEDTGTTAKLFWDASAESLGIGTSSPSKVIHAKASADVSGTPIIGLSPTTTDNIQGGIGCIAGGELQVIGTNQTTFYTGGTRTAFLDSSGNLGLGVTPSAWGTARKAFQIGGGGGLEGHPTNLDYVALSANFYLASDNATYKRINAGYATLYGQDDGTHFWSTAASSTADSTISFTQAMTLDASGRLGIGYTNPTSMLYVMDTSATTPYVSSSTSAAPYVIAQFNRNDSTTNYTAALASFEARGASGTNSIWYIGNDGGTSNYTGNFVIGNRTSSGYAERARIDSSGNLGLGVTPSAWGTLLPLQIGQGASFVGAETSNSAYIASNGYYDAGGSWRYIGTGTAGQYRLAGSDGSHAWFTAPSGTAGNAISFTQAMTLDASGRLLLGTTTPLGAITSKNTSGFIGLSTYTSGGTVSEHTYANAAGLQIDSYQSASGSPYTKTTDIVANADSGAASQMRFFTTAAGSAPAERARIDASGNLLVGTTSAGGVGGWTLYPTGSGGMPYAVWNKSYASTSAAADFKYNGTSVGSIAYTSSATSYNTSSDYRLKEDWVVVTDASTRVKALNPVNFAWKVDGKRVDGFLAHELAEVVPEAVTGEKDAVDADGNPVYQGIDQSKLVPLLTAALQEALAEIEQLKADVAALKGN